VLASVFFNLLYFSWFEPEMVEVCLSPLEILAAPLAEPVDFSGFGFSAPAPRVEKPGSCSSTPAPLRGKTGSGAY